MDNLRKCGDIWEDKRTGKTQGNQVVHGNADRGGFFKAMGRYTGSERRVSMICRWDCSG